MANVTFTGPTEMSKVTLSDPLADTDTVHVFCPDPQSMETWICALSGECYDFDRHQGWFRFNRRGRTINFKLMQDYDSLRDRDMVVLTYAGMRHLTDEKKQEITYALAMLDVPVVDDDTFIRDWSRGFPYR